ncbi:hypothetical protein HanHA300_Chr17g0669851 [Helianthus annuus]|nr:hypothetical protein HanHA300_Chr17g0669851 [Helianthus annuus]KAJ0633803.1 hypothetical protein HanLR1_Chr17g0681011 [Helianthus annuus]
MLMLAESDTDVDNNNEQKHERHRRFFLLSNGGTMRKLPLPEVHWQRCISTHGWLLTTGEQEFYTKLINPLSCTQIELPELYMFDELYTDQDEWMYYGSCMRKAVLGDVSWTRIYGWEGCLFDIVYHRMQKRLYVVATMGTIYECDMINGVLCPLTLSRVTTFPGKEFGCLTVPWAYLLEWGYDSLLMVTRERYYFKKQDVEYRRYGAYRTSRFQCFVFELDNGKWSKIVSLGDKSVFIGLQFVVFYRWW